MSRQQFEGCTASRQSRMRAERTTLCSRWLSNDLYTIASFLPSQWRAIREWEAGRSSRSDGWWLIACVARHTLIGRLNEHILCRVWAHACGDLCSLLTKVTRHFSHISNYHQAFNVPPSRLSSCSLTPVFWICVCCAMQYWTRQWRCWDMNQFVNLLSTSSTSVLFTLMAV